MKLNLPSQTPIFKFLLILSVLAPSVLLHSGLASAAKIMSAVSDGHDTVSLTLIVPGGDISGVVIYRLETGKNYWERLKSGFRRHTAGGSSSTFGSNLTVGSWVIVAPLGPANQNVFFREDVHVTLGKEYCYVATASRKIDPNEKICVIHQPAGSNLQFPGAPANLRGWPINDHRIKLLFEDTADNEAEFLVERRFPAATWEEVATLPSQPGIGQVTTYTDQDLEMSVDYCYRVTASNDDGSRNSFTICRETKPVIVPSVDLPDDSRGIGFLSNVGHPGANSLRVNIIFSGADFDRTFTVGLFLRNNLNGNPVRTTFVRIRGNSRWRTAGATFNNLDSERVYCAKIMSSHINGARFDNRIICESPFARRMSSDHLGPLEADLPVIDEVIPGNLKLILKMSHEAPGQMIDLVDADTGLRQTILEGDDGRDEIQILLAGRKTFCVRSFITNEYGSRYGRFICAQTFGAGGGIGPPPTGGVSPPGGGNNRSGLRAGVDCGCSMTGQFVDAVAPAGGNASADGIYRVETIGNSVAVFRNSDNVRVFIATNLNNGFQFGFGPRSRYFSFAEPQTPNRVAVGVHDLEGSVSDNRPFFAPNVLSSAGWGWGFSPDGRTFMLARENSNGQLTINLANLDERFVKILLFSLPFSGFWQFSLCGDAFVVGIGDNPFNIMPTLGLWATVDGTVLKQAMSIGSDFSKVVTNSTNHVANRTQGSALIIAPNQAGEACTVSPTDSATYPLQVARFSSTSISNNEVDQIFSSASMILQTVDGADDFACNVTFERSGSVNTFNVGDGSIDSNADLDAVLNIPGNAKVVNQLNFCGVVGAFLGCADKPGTSFVFVRDTLEDSTVAHEFGHNKGLEHRSDINAVMADSAASTNLQVNQAECFAYLTTGLLAMVFPPISYRFVAAELPMFAASISNASIQPPPISIEEFVRRRYFEGVPYDAARRYDSSVIPTLLDMLDNVRDLPHWSNIAIVLGIIGDGRVVDPMIEFIERDSPRMTRGEYRAKTSAILALGYVVNHSGDENALEYLTDGLKPATWETRLIQGWAPYQSNIAERNRDFSKFSILGLAVAGTAESRRALEEFQETVALSKTEQYRTPQLDLIREMLKEHTKVSEQGLSGYYRRVK